MYILYINLTLFVDRRIISLIQSKMYLISQSLILKYVDMLLYVDTLWFLLPLFHIGFNFKLDNYINNLPKETFYSIMTFKRHAVFVVFRLIT